MEQILAVFESQHDAPQVIVSSQASKKLAGQLDVETDIRKADRPQTSPPEYDLYITNSRFLCAVVWDEETDVPKDSSLPYDVIVQQSYAPTKSTRRTSYQGRTPDEIEEMHPKSLSIPFDQVDWVKVKKSLFGTAHVEINVRSRRNEPFKIRIEKSRYDEAKSILSGHLGLRLM